MMRARLAVLLTLAASAALAQTAAPPPDAGPPGWSQFVAQVEPALMSFLAIAVTAGLALLGILLKQIMSAIQADIQAWLARMISDSQRAQVSAAAKTGAEKLFAAAPPTSDIATKSITLNSDEVKAVADWIKGPGAADAATSLKLSDATIDGKAQAALGAQQIAAATPSGTVVAPVAGVVESVTVSGNATVGKPQTKGSK